MYVSASAPSIWLPSPPVEEENIPYGDESGIITLERQGTEKFAPLSGDYWGQTTEWFKDHSLLKDILVHFPFQPEMPHFHPAMHLNYLIQKVGKGFYYFLPYTGIDTSEDLIKYFRKTSVVKDIRVRSEHRAQTFNNAERAYFELRFFIEKQKTHRRFSMATDAARRYRLQYRKLMRSYQMHHFYMQEELTRQKNMEIQFKHAHFWRDHLKYLRNHPKHTRGIPSSETNITELLRGIAVEKDPKVITSILSKLPLIQMNADKKNLLQLIERAQFGGTSLPAFLFNFGANYLHRYRKIMEYHEYLERAYSEKFAILKKDAVKKRNKINEEKRQLQVLQEEESIKNYQLQYNKAHEQLRLSMLSSSTSPQEMKRLMKFIPPSRVYHQIDMLDNKKHIKEEKEEAKLAESKEKKLLLIDHLDADKVKKIEQNKKQAINQYHTELKKAVDNKEKLDLLPRTSQKVKPSSIT